MNAETAHLQRELDAEKAALAENLSALEAKARGITDWRAHVGKHPLAAVGVALVGGMALAMLTRRRPIVIVHRGAPRTDGAAPASTAESLMSNPVVGRVVEALVAVAAAKAVDVLSDMIPGFSGHVATEEPAPPSGNGATAPSEFPERRTSPTRAG